MRANRILPRVSEANVQTVVDEQNTGGWALLQVIPLEYVASFTLVFEQTNLVAAETQIAWDQVKRVRDGVQKLREAALETAKWIDNQAIHTCRMENMPPCDACKYFGLLNAAVLETNGGGR